MEMIVQQGWRDAAAIGYVAALQQYGLEVLARGIGNPPQNKTKFAVLGDRFHAPTGTDATSVVIYPHRDRIGLLEDILHLISRDGGLNLSSIHSRPDTKGGFRFYIEVEGHAEDLAVARCWRRWNDPWLPMASKCESLRVSAADVQRAAPPYHWLDWRHGTDGSLV
jgi:prephenate dehydratase